MRALIAASPQQTRAGLPQDRQQQYDITPVPMRTFVEIPRFPGITYKASRWFHVGTTQGRGRYDTKMEFGKPKKDIWLCPLGRDRKGPPNRRPSVGGQGPVHISITPQPSVDSLTLMSSQDFHSIIQSVNENLVSGIVGSSS
ncbi:MAG: DUF4338 domain-containing protein [Paracoccaceae bacterium]|nr:DUF4338 domain-containing protein [Paracoccaceae bacterium]